jgi:hypothetical protein
MRNWFDSFDLLAFIGTFCLGVVMMWLVRLFAVRIVTPTISWLGAFVSALIGGAALGFLGHYSKGSVWPHEFWGYSIGLAAGLFFFSDAVQKEMNRRDHP